MSGPTKRPSALVEALRRDAAEYAAATERVITGLVEPLIEAGLVDDEEPSDDDHKMAPK